MSLPVALSEASKREAASSLSSGDTLRGDPMIACCTSARILCASSTSFVPSSKRRRERSSIDSISTRRAGRLVSAILVGFAPLLALTGPDGPTRYSCWYLLRQECARFPGPCRRCECRDPRLGCGCRPARRFGLQHQEGSFRRDCAGQGRRTAHQSPVAALPSATAQLFLQPGERD